MNETEERESILLQNLTNDEYYSLPELIRNKIDSLLKTQLETSLTSRAIYETTRATNEEKITTLSNQITELEKEYDQVKTEFITLKDQLSEVQSSLDSSKSENLNLNSTIKKLEDDCLEFRRQRDLAVDERNEAVKMVERRNNELQRLQEDVATLTNQLQAAVQAKCEALANVDEVESMKLTLDYREKRLTQERGLLEQQVQSLTEDLAKQTADITNMRREYTSNLVTLRNQLAEKSEELKISTTTNSQLTETNKALNLRVEALTEKLIGQCETENKLNENYQQEIQAQTKLAALYKGLSEDATAKNEELTEAVKELQSLLKDASDQYGELENKLKEREVALEVTTEKKNLCIQELKKELEHANELLEATKQQSIEKAVESLSPAAAVTSRLLKSGLTLTQLYMQYAECSEQLMLEKEENKRLTHSMNTILHEIEQKAPLLKKQREDYDYAMTTVESLTARMDEMEVEASRLRSANLEAEKISSHFKRENKRLQDTMSDLGRQVCFLLKEVEESRGNSVEMTRPQPRPATDLSTSAQVISKHLVTFKDIQELQITNQKLLKVVRELSEKQEQAEQEKDSDQLDQLGSKLRLAEQRIASLQETEAHYIKAMEVIKGQREMYRTLFQQQVAGLPHIKVEELERAVIHLQSQSPVATTSDAQNLQTPPRTSPGQQAKIEMLEQKLKDKMQELNQLQEDFSTYKKEKSVNENMLMASLEKARDDVRSLAVSKSEVVAKAEFSEEKFKVLKANADSYKAQIQALEKKNNNYSATIAKHEQTILHLRDECVDANSKLSRSEVRLENLQRECQMLKECEARFTREREMLSRQTNSQAALMTNLEMLKATFERSEVEGKLKLETKLEEAQKECAALRRRLQEEQDRFRERTDALERSMESARVRLDEEKDIGHGLRTQLEDLRRELRDSKETVEQLTAKVRTTSHKVVPDPQTEKRVSMLELQLAEKDGEICCLKEKLAASKKHAEELSEISHSSEKQMLEITSSYSKYREDVEAKVKALSEKEVVMKNTIAELEGRVSVLSSAQQESANSLDGREEALSSATSELKRHRSEVVYLQAELTETRTQLQAAEEKYSHEMMLHADDIQSMNKVKTELNEVLNRIKDLEAQKEKAEDMLKVGKEGWLASEAKLNSQLTELTDRLSDLDKQNSLLHDQLQELGLKVAVVHSQENLSSSLLDTSTEDDNRSSDHLLQVLKYIRKEKAIAVATADALRAETLRLRAQFELQSRKLQEAQELLEAERSQNKINLTTANKHEELLRKVDTLNALTDSNRVLRDERDKLLEKVNNLEQEIAKKEEEVITPFRERVAKLTSQVDQMSTENTALKAECNRWRSRVNVLIEKQNKNSPEDFKRLTTEKENLTKQIATLNEELKTAKADKSKTEELLNNMKKERDQQAEQMTALQRNLGQVKSELAEVKTEVEKKVEEIGKLTQDFSTQEATLTDIKSKELQIRQIAKKYKTQYQELLKSNEEEKKKKEAVVMSMEEQEKLRDEGRQEAEKRQADRLKQLTDQVTTIQTEASNLREENEQLRATNADKEERAKVLLKNARARIMLLTDEKRKLATENSDLKNKVDTLDRNIDDSDVRQRRADKEKADLIADKERLTREVEILTQRANLLQRQVDKLQGGVKPSTSSGVEKSSVEPPTANIKPMAGPSSSVTKQQPTQHSVTVTPWRGGGSETPFASIRPMSLQSRTVAVLPTTNQSSQAVLVPPQQQMVHTSTGTVEVLSSSPTSSHTDYMPATSSGVTVTIRQATVPPTQLPPPSTAAESTQDMEVEGSAGSIQAGAANNPQVLSIALVLPQPTAQTSTQTTQTQSVASTQQEQSVEQNVVSASNHAPGPVPSDQGLVSASSNQQTLCSTVPAYYRQELEESGQSVASSHTAATEQSVVASSESQLAEASNSAEQSPAAMVASSYANSSNTVTTSQAGPGNKRLRDSSGSAEEESSKSMPPTKRGRAIASASLTEVEYQVPTSSQRDQEDDVVLVDSDEEEEDEDEEVLVDQEFEDEGDAEEAYEMEVYSRNDQAIAYEVGEGPDIDENITDQDNNEVEVNEDSNEVPNQSESIISGVGGGEATSSGQGQGRNGRGDASVSSAQPYARRTSTHIAPLNRQQPLLLPGNYEDVGDDSIVPSTPTLFVPRRTDGFGEAVSSPHVPSGRFTFSDNTPPTTRAGVAQVASEGMDDTRMDLSQLEDTGTGRSVPSTPLQVSPQEQIGGEVGQSSSSVTEDQPEPNNNLQHIPTITVTAASATTTPLDHEMPPPSDVEDTTTEECQDMEPQDAEGAEVLEEPDMDPEESGDGVSSEGEKTTSVLEDVEEGREAEATETVSVPRGSGTARRSIRAGTVRGRATRNPPTPIVWDEDSPSTAVRGPSPVFSRLRTSSIITRSTLVDPARGTFRGRTRRRGSFYQPRF